jgi:hypothetical protein
MKSVVSALVLASSLLSVACGSSDGGGGDNGGTGGTAGVGGGAGMGGQGGTGATDVRVVEATPVVGTLTVFPDSVMDADGSDLFPEGSVQAHWYQWNGFYVVLYRGYDATDPMSVCPGTRILIEGGFDLETLTSSPYPSDGDEACVDARNVVVGASRRCGPLLYYVTNIPVSSVGELWGTIEKQTGAGFIGQTTFGTASDIENTPDFQPGQPTYELPPSDVDDLERVDCL